MAQSSILGGEPAPRRADGRSADVLGPSDTSDSGSDIQGATRLKTDTEEGELGGTTPIATDSDSDSMGTGERAEAVPEGARDGADIAPDRIARSQDALDGADASIDPDEVDELALDDSDADAEDDDSD